MGKTVVVIGSGIGGLTAAALLQKEGWQVKVLEAAAEWGGCAGKFQRDKFIFPAGATLAMGFEEGGLHEQINKHLGIRMQTERLEHVMDVRIEDRVFPYYSNRGRLLSMWEREEPAYALQIMNFFNEVWHIGKVLRQHMKHYPVLPPMSAGELAALKRGFSLSSLPLIRYIGKTLEYLIVKHKLEGCRSFRHFINGVLMDSMQTTYEQCSLLMGAAALDVYHHGAYYAEGGLYRLAEELVNSVENNGGQLLKPRIALSVKQEKQGWAVKDHRGGVHKCDHAVLNLPVSSLEDVLHKDVYKKLHRSYKRKSDPFLQWGTFTVYLAIREQIIPDKFPLFHQIMVDSSKEPTGSNHFFMSLSRKNDYLRAPAGFRTMTVSTHINLPDWQTIHNYDNNAADIIGNVLDKLEEMMPGFNENCERIVTGGPRAWEKFVLRKEGGVGGFPQTNKNALWRAVSHRTKLSGLWLCGDNIYPAAGTIGAASSGVHVARSITGKRLI